MAHVTFIHGICNKPPKQKLLEDWEYYLEQGGLNLASKGVTTSMVYWADVMYEKPLEPEENFESVSDGLGTSEANEDLSWIEDLPDDQKAFVEALRGQLGLDKPSPDGDDYTPEFSPEEDEANLEMGFEAIPLPWFIKRRVMKALLKDVHHYLFNASFSPRPGENYKVQEHIRNLFVKQLQNDKENREGPHVVVSHSMGTVISYDCLKNVPGCPAIDSYMTVGSPLGLSEVHDTFKPEYIKNNAFPNDKVSENWINVFDRLDPVAFDAHLANDYLKNGREVILDQRVHNEGSWRHSSNKYYGQEILCDHLRRLLKL